MLPSLGFLNMLTKTANSFGRIRFSLLDLTYLANFLSNNFSLTLSKISQTEVASYTYIRFLVKRLLTPQKCRR